MDIAIKIFSIVSAVITGAIVALNVIAPLTKSRKDDKVKDFLVWVHDKVLAAVLPFIAAKVADTVVDETKEAV